MQKCLTRRLLLVIPTLWLVISMLFLGVNLLPGDSVDSLALFTGSYRTRFLL